MTWQDPRRSCRAVGMPASCRRRAAPYKGTPWYPAPHPGKLGASQISPGGNAPLHPGQNVSGGQEGTGTCPALAPIAASHDLQEPSTGPRSTQVRSRAVPGPSVLRPGNEPPAGLLRMMELEGDSLAPGSTSAWRVLRWHRSRRNAFFPVMCPTLLPSMGSFPSTHHKVIYPLTSVETLHPPAHRTSQEQLMAVILAAQPFAHCLENFRHHSQLACPWHLSLPTPCFSPVLETAPSCIFFPTVTNLLPAAEFPSCFSHTQSTP